MKQIQNEQDQTPQNQAPQQQRRTDDSHRSKHKPHKAKQRPIDRSKPKPHQSHQQPVGTSDYTQQKEEQGQMPVKGDLKLLNWKVAERPLGKHCKLSVDCAILYAGKPSVEYGILKSKMGSATVAEANMSKKGAALGKYSRKLLELDLSNGGVILADGVTLSAGINLFEFKTSLSDIKGLKSKNNKIGKGVAGMGFDMDFASLSIKAACEVSKQTQGNGLVRLIAGMPGIEYAVAHDLPLKFQVEFKFSLLGPDLDLLKKQKQLYNALDKKATEVEGQAQQLERVKQQQKNNQKLRKRIRNLERKAAQMSKNDQKAIATYRKELEALNKEYAEFVKARQHTALLDTKGVPLKDRPAKTIYYDNPHIGKTTTEQSQFVKGQIQKLEQQKATNSASLKRYAGLGDKPPSIQALTAQGKVIKAEIALEKAKLKQLTTELNQTAKEIAEVGAKYETKLGRRLGKDLMAKAGRRLAQLNLIAEVVEALAFLLAWAMAPERLTSIFSGKSSSDGTALLTLMVQDRMEGDKTHSVNGTTDIRKSSQHGTSKEVLGGVTTDNPNAHRNDKGKRKIVFNKKAEEQKKANGKITQLLKILDTQPQARKLWGAMLANAVLKGQHTSLMKEFTAQHAHELVRIAQRYGNKLDLIEVTNKHNRATTDKGTTMDDYLAKLEGVCARTLDPTIKKGQEDNPKVDRENQHVVHDKGLEKEKKPLTGEAKKGRSISKNTVNYKPKGRYIIEGVDKSSYAIDSELILRFYGTYHGQKADFNGIKVVVVESPRTVKGTRYVRVKFPYDQEVVIQKINKSVYFTPDLGSFYVKIN
ncbi:hypothetical protein [uncultured Microscilla sp.]|uniref:hypothetical protein n=1 Tax=uncultured Microscilla sp. TaxID=432653 RepID=UPI002628A87F|nr:hypothetical protein [uncultured Microscilla sp.]